MKWLMIRSREVSRKQHVYFVSNRSVKWGSKSSAVLVKRYRQKLQFPPVCHVTFCLQNAMKTRGEEDQNSFIILGSRIKINSWKSVEVLCNFLNFWMQVEWMQKCYGPFFFPLVFHCYWIFVFEVPACCRNQGTESLQAAHRSGDFISWVI